MYLAPVAQLEGRALSIPEALVSEAADLVFHLYVLLAAADVDLSEVEDELAARAK